MAHDTSDDDLIVAVGHGDRAALAVLYRRHHAQVHRVCHGLVGDAATADDLVQESFVRVLRYARGFQGRAAFSTWLYRLVRNVCLGYLEAEARRARREQAAARDRAILTPAGGEDARVAVLREALTGLSPEHREVLVLSRYQGFSYAEIAEVCDTTEGAIKARAHRAMRELRRRFAELEKTT